MAQVKKGKVLFLSCSALLSTDDILLLKVDAHGYIDREKLKKKKRYTWSSSNHPFMTLL